jgi:hypothetical protein
LFLVGFQCQLGTAREFSASENPMAARNRRRCNEAHFNGLEEATKYSFLWLELAGDLNALVHHFCPNYIHEMWPEIPTPRMEVGGAERGQQSRHLRISQVHAALHQLARDFNAIYRIGAWPKVLGPVKG